MRFRVLALAGTTAAAVAVVALGTLSVSVAGQAPAPKPSSAKPKPVAKTFTTPWGDPDLRGVYVVATVTPLQRAKQFGDREFMTAEEAAAAEKRARDNGDRETDIADGDTGYYNKFWVDPGKAGTKVANLRTSLIIDPKDGRLPPLTPQAQKVKERIDRILKEDGNLVFNRVGPSRLAREGSGLADSYLDRDSTERCVARSMPKLGGPYNNGVQIGQGPGYVVINYESRDTRTIPLDGRAHLPASIHQWLGDSVGHWEGKALVVDTTNFSDEQGYMDGYPQGHLHLVERFTRNQYDTIDYTATFEDPATFTRPFTVSLPWTRDDDYVIYEYACHEGNQSLTGILAGARADEKKAGKSGTQ